MSKSSSASPNIEITGEVELKNKIKALQYEINYWKTRYNLLEKYCKIKSTGV